MRTGRYLTGEWEKEVFKDMQKWIEIRRRVLRDVPFEQWTEVLGSERRVGATLDRLPHRCHILEATGESYRLKDAKRHRSRARTRRKPGSGRKS